MKWILQKRFSRQVKPVKKRNSKPKIENRCKPIEKQYEDIGFTELGLELEQILSNSDNETQIKRTQ